MNKKESISVIAASLLKKFDNDTVLTAAEFLHSIETRRQRYKPDDAEISHQRKRLEQKIKKAFSDVTCYREVRVLLEGEAEDEYWPTDVQALYRRWRNEKAGRIYLMVYSMPVPAL